MAGPAALGADPVTTAVVRHGLISAAEQMKRALVRTAFNPIIYEVQDFAVALYDRKVRLLAQALGMQHFMGRLGFGVEASVEAVGGESALQPGDILFYNVPYLSGAHANDAAVVMPVFIDDELIGYSAITAHWLDVGGKEPTRPTRSTSSRRERSSPASSSTAPVNATTTSTARCSELPRTGAARR